MRPSHKLILIIILSIGLIDARAQYRFDSWTTDDGLPQNTVSSITQSPEGYIWFATGDGLVRFDGVKFRVFNKSNSTNFPTNRLRLLTLGEEGTLWISTENEGLLRYQDGRFRRFTTADGLPSNDVISVHRKQGGGLLVVTKPAIVSTDNGGQSFSLFKEQDVIAHKLYSAPTGTIWHVDGDALSRLDQNGNVRKYKLPFEPSPERFDQTYSFQALATLYENNGVLWFGAGPRLFRLQDNEFTAFDSKNGLPGSRIRTIANDGFGNLWVGTEKHGACRLNSGGFVCFDTTDGLSSNNVMEIFLDLEKTMWIGTENAGLNRVTPQVIESLSTSSGLAATNVYPVFQDASGAFWVGAYGGLAQVIDDKVTNYSKQNGLIYDLVQSLFEDRDGLLWVGSVGGVQTFSDGKAVDFTTKLGLKIGEPDFWDIHQTSDGAMWFATNRGLYRYSNGVPTKFSTANGLPSDDVRVIKELRNGSLWVGTAGGAALYHGNEFKPVTDKDGLAGNYVRSIYEDEEGLIWFGTYDSGISVLRDGRFSSITAENGLFSNGVFSILSDDRGNFWMSSNQGIYRVARRQLIDFADGLLSSVTSTAFGKSDGMLSTECNGGRQPAAVKAEDGRLWFATQDGVAIVDPNLVPFNPQAPSVVIEEVTIDQKPVEKDPNGILVQPGASNLQINYTGLSFIKPEQIRFRYKLEGLDEGWTDAANRRAAYYPYLPPGDYVFRITAANSDNVWGEKSTDIAIRVLPAFYRRWWFITLAGLLIGALAFVFYKRRVGRIERARQAQEEFSRRLINAHETERRRIAAELHDSLGQSLAIIKNQAVFSARTINDLNEAKKQFDRISNQSAQAISEVREISYNLRPYLLDRLGMTKAVRSMLKKISEVGAIDVHSDIDDIDGMFSAETEISTYRVLQESLNNILKHSEASEAKVSIKKKDRVVSIRIEDNGRGFDARPSKFDVHSTMAGERTGFGLFGMAERIRILGGTHTIESEIGKGTVVKIDLTTSTNGTL